MPFRGLKSLGGGSPIRWRSVASIARDIVLSGRSFGSSPNGFHLLTDGVEPEERIRDEQHHRGLRPPDGLGETELERRQRLVRVMQRQAERSRDVGSVYGTIVGLVGDGRVAVQSGGPGAFAEVVLVLEAIASAAETPKSDAKVTPV
jgi:hypothetical protein